MTSSYGRQFIRELKREIRMVQRSLEHSWTAGMVALRNWLRQMRHLKLDYVLIPVGGPLPERAAPPRTFIQRQLPLPPETLSLQALNYRFQRIAQADNVRGVVLVFEGLTAGLATLQNLRQSISRLRAAGKEVVVYTPYLDMEHYFAATAANRIIAPPVADFAAVGVRTEAVFLKDALAQLGIEADILQISPYKTAGNSLSQADITPEQREQLEWLLDEKYELMVTAVAADRGLTIEELKAHIDAAPFNMNQALERGLIDKIGYQDDIAPWLAAADDKPDAAAEANGDVDNGNGEETAVPRAKLRRWAEAEPMLMEKPIHYHPQAIGIITVEGLIAMGVSRQSPSRLPIPLPMADGITAGERTIIGLLRQAEKDREVAAIILYVDSPGGSALASDLIWQQIVQTQKKKPVLAYMGNVAASGGYYVSAPAKHIMSQAATITGSIGVLLGRISTGGLYQKVHVNRVSLARGAHAELFSDLAPLNDEERQILLTQLKDTYRRFQDVVMEGRDIAAERLDDIAQGKVWSGRQALAFQLVDSHGDFEAAVAQATELAGITLRPDEKMGTINFYARPRETGLLGALLSSEAPGLSDAAQLLSLFDGRFLAELHQKPLYLFPYIIR
jgi:protease IV